MRTGHSSSPERSATWRVPHNGPPATPTPPSGPVGSPSTTVNGEGAETLRVEASVGPLDDAQEEIGQLEHFGRF